MRGPRKDRWLTLSVFMIAYFQAVFSATVDQTSLEETPVAVTNSDGTVEVETTSIVIPTIHPLRNCMPPAIEQFPLSLIRGTARKHGGLIIHILVTILTFMGLAIVCEEYFVASLIRICKEFNLAPDVAGATLMAAGSSAPELATVIIGVFAAEDDIGVSGVASSAVFKMIFVISVCALCAGTVPHLSRWPLYRNCLFYAISILAVMYIIINGQVSWPEALFMLIMYGVYCIALCFNTVRGRCVQQTITPFKLPTRREEVAHVTIISAVPPTTTTDAAGDVNDATYNPSVINKNAAYNAESAQISRQDQNHTRDPEQAWEEPSVATAPANDKAKEYNPETAVDPLVKPVGANKFQLFYWYISFPIRLLCRYTMPDCRGRWYPITFIISMLWIYFYSYFMVWMITIIGFTLGIPDAVMGLTFSAAGLSVPAALSSLAVIKKGYGDMAVSNAVGSNLFDILVCLGLPWFMQTAIIYPGSRVNVISKGLVYSTLSLLSTVVFFVVATHANGWKLDRKYGAVLMVWHLLFITFASLYELDFFGDFHPPECLSIY